MGTFNIIPDPRQKIYQEMFVMDGVPDFHPPYRILSYVNGQGNTEAAARKLSDTLHLYRCKG